MLQAAVIYFDDDFVALVEVQLLTGFRRNDQPAARANSAVKDRRHMVACSMIG